jgi:hypothetical protein
MQQQTFFSRLSKKYGISEKALNTHIGEQFILSSINISIDSFLDYRLRISSLMADSFYIKDYDLLQLEIDAVDEFLSHFFANKEL